MTPETPIQRFARLRLVIDRCMAQRVDIPLHVQNEYQSLLAWANATLTPEQGQQALRMANEFAQQVLSDEKAEIDASVQKQEAIAQRHGELRNHLANALRDRGAGVISRAARVGSHESGHSLSGDQLVSAYGTQKYTQPARKAAAEKAAAALRESTGRDWKPEHIKAQVEKLGELYSDESKLRAAAEAKHPGSIPEQNAFMRSVRSAYLQARLQERSEEQDRKNHPDRWKDTEVKLDSRDMTRLTIADAIVSQDPNDLQDRVLDRGKRDYWGNAQDTRAAVVDAVESSWVEEDAERVHGAIERIEAVEDIAREEGML